MRCSDTQPLIHMAEKNRPPKPRPRRAAGDYSLSSSFFGSVQTMRPCTLMPS